MIIHSVAPISNLLPQPEQQEHRYIPFAKGYLECLCCKNGDLTIQRVISTDPTAYLDGALAPGAPFGQTTPKGRAPYSGL